jgi:peptide-methionine (R)-S-oxide reductase
MLRSCLILLSSLLPSSFAYGTPRPTRRILLGAGAASFAAPAVASQSRSDGYAVQKTSDEWKSSLTPYQYYILREGGTEPPNSSPLYKEKRPGTFRCVGCDAALFDAAAKFESGTGWPSFAQPLQDVQVLDKGFISAVLGSEVRCGRCGGHLGDVFPDGLLFPGTMAMVTGKRFCIDGTALVFEPSTSGSMRVSGEPPPAVNSPADVQLPAWLQPPPINQV